MAENILAAVLNCSTLAKHNIWALFTSNAKHVERPAIDPGWSSVVILTFSCHMTQSTQQFTFSSPLVFDKVIICFLPKNSRTASSRCHKGRAIDPKTLRISSTRMAYLIKCLSRYFQFCLSSSVKDAEVHL